MEVKVGDTIVTVNGWQGEIVSVLTNTAVVDFSNMENYEDYFEDVKQVVRLADIRQVVTK